jgi:hypothetical protein
VGVAASVTSGAAVDPHFDRQDQTVADGTLSCLLGILPAQSRQREFCSGAANRPGIDTKRSMTIKTISVSPDRLPKKNGKPLADACGP